MIFIYFPQIFRYKRYFSWYFSLIVKYVEKLQIATMFTIAARICKLHLPGDVKSKLFRCDIVFSFELQSLQVKLVLKNDAMLLRKHLLLRSTLLYWHCLTSKLGQL